MEKIPVCRDNLQGHCSRGAFCRYQHVESDKSRSTSPCHDFLRGCCKFGASCNFWHPVTMYDRTRYDSSRVEHQGASVTSRTPGFGDGSKATPSMISKSRPTKDGVELAGDRRNMDVTSRRRSCARQRSRSANDFGGEKRARQFCLKFTRGKCNRGELCKYLHGYHDYATADQSEKPYTEGAENIKDFALANQKANTMMAQEHDRFGGDKRARKVCLKFTRGKCNHGELCKYLHGYHDYATADQSEKPYTEGDEDVKDFAVANQKANTMMAQEHADIKNYKMSLGESRDFESSQDGVMHLSRPPVLVTYQRRKKGNRQEEILKIAD